MLGLPWWGWVILAVLGFIALRIRAYYSGFRAMCRGVRDELTKFLKTHHPEVEVIEERRGDLIVRMQDGSERVWEMADVYYEVGRLPALGADPQARESVYQEAVRNLFVPAPNAGEPLSLSAHGDRIMPQLVPDHVIGGSETGAGMLQSPIPGLGLTVIYVIPLVHGVRPLTEEDREILGLDAAGVHRLALDNLRKQFPAEMVRGALSEEIGTAIRSQDAFDAARLLLVPEHLGNGEELIALAPNQQTLVLLPGSPREDESKLREGLRLLQCPKHPVLLDHPVRITREGFELLTPAP